MYFSAGVYLVPCALLCTRRERSHHRPWKVWRFHVLSWGVIVEYLNLFGEDLSQLPWSHLRLHKLFWHYLFVLLRCRTCILWIMILGFHFFCTFWWIYLVLLIVQIEHMLWRCKWIAKWTSWNQASCAWGTWGDCGLVGQEELPRSSAVWNGTTCYDISCTMRLTLVTVLP